MLVIEVVGGCTSNDGQIQWCCHSLCIHQYWIKMQTAASHIPEYTKTFIFLLAIMSRVVTFTQRTVFLRRPSVHQTSAAHFSGLTPPASPIPSSYKMPADDKSRVAAAQLLIDDEPDEWCVAIAEKTGTTARSLANQMGRDKRIFSTGCAGTGGLELTKAEFN